MARSSEAELPDRYRVRYRFRKGVKSAVLTAAEAPTVCVRIERGVSFTAAAARGHPPGSIFLDGAAQAEPFADRERGVYNLDHHEGCVRAFTLSACEQAMVLVRTSLDLRARDWTVYANDADLDAVLAIWVLLNHLRLNDDPRVRAEIMPLLRLQGAIDAHGLELEDLCALPPALYRETRARMDELRERELWLKARGLWQETDLLEYVADRLRAIDAQVYSPAAFDDVREIEELARAEIAGRSVAVACRSESGIYEIERQLRRFHGSRLGLIILKKDDSTYSLRQVDPALPSTLETVYGYLNLVDPAAGGNRSANRWGGSAEIGGSPRRSGSRLTVQRITQLCREAYERPAPLQRAGRLARAACAGGALLLAALAAIPAAGSALPGWQAFAAALLGLAGACYLFAAQRAPGLHGLRLPVGGDGWAVAPLALLGALAGGVGLPPLPAPDASLTAAAAALLAQAAGQELLFRGWLHGQLVRSFRIQFAGGPWRLSVPVLATSALYALWSALPLFERSVPAAAWLGDAGGLLPLAGALAFGLAAGLARERTESVLAPLALHAAGVVAGAAAVAWWG